MSQRQNLFEVVIEAIVSIIVAIALLWGLAPLFWQFGVGYFLLFTLFMIGVIIAIIMAVYSRFRY